MTIALNGCFQAVLGIAGAGHYAIEGYTGGLLMIIAILLAIILFVLATKEGTP